jgi:hypothetical protein
VSSGVHGEDSRPRAVSAINLVNPLRVIDKRVAIALPLLNPVIAPRFKGVHPIIPVPAIESTEHSDHRFPAAGAGVIHYAEIRHAAVVTIVANVHVENHARHVTFDGVTWLP